MTEKEIGNAFAYKYPTVYRHIGEEPWDKGIVEELPITIVEVAVRKNSYTDILKRKIVAPYFITLRGATLTRIPRPRYEHRINKALQKAEKFAERYNRRRS